MKKRLKENLLEVSEGMTYTINGFDKRKFISCYDENGEPFAVVKSNNYSNTFTVPQGTHYIGFGKGSELNAKN